MRKTAETGPNPVDIHVGMRIRARRKVLGVSQSKLAETVDMSFQQVQKYERGANRVSASVLFTFSHALKCPIQDFFSGLDQPDAPSTDPLPLQFFAATDGAVLAQTYLKLPRGQRRIVVGLAKDLAQDEAAA